jgi:hypothetical protein
MNQKHKNKFDFEGWRAFMEGMGYILLATSFMERIIGRLYLFVLPIEFFTLLFIIWRMMLAKRNEINNKID